MVTRATCRPAKAARLARQRMIARACLAGALLLAGCGKTEPPAPRAQAGSVANRPAMAPVAASPASAASAALGPPSLQVATQGETRRADAAMLERGATSPPPPIAPPATTARTTSRWRGAWP